MMPGAVTLIGAVRGLESEGERVAALLAELKPDVIGLSLSREALATMAKLQDAGSADSSGSNPEEDAYIRGLSAFGEVIKPPPCFYRAWKVASDARIPIEAIDMDEEHYTIAYCKHVGTLDMVRQGRSAKLFDGYEFRANSPEELVVEWDGLVNRLKGFKNLEMAREAWMAKGICRLAISHARPAIVIEFERLDGIKTELEKTGCAAKTV